MRNEPEPAHVTYIAIALIVGAALALAVALAVASGQRTRRGRRPAEPPRVPPLCTRTTRATAALAAADPAKEQPLLDKFTSKDPFIPFPTPGATTTPAPNPDEHVEPPTNLSAKVKVDGTTYKVIQGDKVPGGSAAEFTVTSRHLGGRQFQVIDGALENGDTSFSVNLGEAVRVTLDAGVSYDIAVISIGSSSGGGGSGGGTATPSPCSASTARTAWRW